MMRTRSHKAHKPEEKMAGQEACAGAPGRRLASGSVLTVLAVACLAAWQFLSGRPKGGKQVELITAEGHEHKVKHATKPVSDEVAQQVASLSSQYEKMGAEFATKGLDVDAIRALQPWFHGLQPGEHSWPKTYLQFEPPLPPHSVRLLVIPLDESPAIASAAAAAASRIAALLPKGIKIFSNARAQYHCTVFHSSHPTDTRPDPFQPGGGLSHPAGEPHERPAATDAVLQHEIDTVSLLVGASRSPDLELHSLVMTRTGTLLLTWVDNSGHATQLRHALRTTFPGATSKQASIIHTSLFRIVSDEQLPTDVVSRINDTCASLTQSLKGKRFSPRHMWWVDEVEFSTVVGPRQLIEVGAD